MVNIVRFSYFSLPPVYSTTGAIRSQVTKLDKLAPANSYSLLLSVNSPGDLGPNEIGKPIKLLKAQQDVLSDDEDRDDDGSECQRRRP